MARKRKGRAPVPHSRPLLQQIVVKFVDHIPPLDPTNVAQSIHQHGLGPWEQLVRSFPGITIKPAFPQVWDNLDQLVRIAKSRSPKYVAPNFKAYCVIDATSETDLQALVADVKKWHTVEAANVALPVIATTVNAGPNPGEINQTYHLPAPDGIDAQFAWTVPGGDGADQTFADVELSAIMLDHEDLVNQNISILPSNTYNVGNPYHGTEGIGVICAADNTVGGIGIVPNAKQCYFYPIAQNSFQGVAQQLPFMFPG